MTTNKEWKCTFGPNNVWAPRFRRAQSHNGQSPIEAHYDLKTYVNICCSGCAWTVIYPAHDFLSVSTSEPRRRSSSSHHCRFSSPADASAITFQFHTYSCHIQYGKLDKLTSQKGKKWPTNWYKYLFNRPLTGKERVLPGVDWRDNIANSHCFWKLPYNWSAVIDRSLTLSTDTAQYTSGPCPAFLCHDDLFILRRKLPTAVKYGIYKFLIIIYLSAQKPSTAPKLKLYFQDEDRWLSLFSLTGE